MINRLEILYGLAYIIRCSVQNKVEIRILNDGI